ncbi:phthiocerol/phenolphthiocerol synthesis type-I polyketide synthase E [Kitasatospora sp. MAA4]|uniref:type I polyketide synthase n=1 Tax=Kitasatospora sp. MAA4 TaxID=3035093 RepID=UPI0024731ABF|nr:beta-ketoacyl synthase N-terminal-like domain-containing protein [Kitasatospora sp. MAA4]MDH6130790.1 phthiocerol/phenolphthiocerol synthesis type-I polyketide synthase E [Kitasatospora sp. MAA4]
MADNDSTDNDIAVIGMAARFPGADTVEEFWANLAAGRESIRPITDEEFLAAGGDPADLTDPQLVRMASVIEGIDRFDSAFFGYSPAEAEVIDPQQRLLLECAYHALEESGYAADLAEQSVGVYAGAGDSRYYPAHVYPRFAGRSASVELVHAATANSLGTLATRISYELGLTGPSLSLQTACSTALVAIHTACQDLLNYACDLALAGAASLNPSAMLGYRHIPDGPFSPDGRCRAFDADAGGTSSGDGVGVVVLKRLADALADGDRIRAVIKGSAINNDGRRKVGFSAPSRDGQLDAILQAQAAAGVDADSITYVEAHGTATRIGDPIEVAALTAAFRESTDRRQYCALGSVKTNIGHLGAAAGMAGFIKTVLALEHGQIPPTLHQRAPNPLIDFAASPFRVPAALEEWESAGGPRRAAVSAFGIGGTNAHVVLQQAPADPRQDPPAREDVPRWHALALSARTPGALRGQGERLSRHLDNPGFELADVAHTLRTHRPAMAHRAVVVAASSADAAELLRHPLPASPAVRTGRAPAVAFLLPGGGTQYIGMGAQLYRDQPLYRATVDRCAAILRPVLGRDLRTALYEHVEPGSVDAFLALVVTEYALATVLIERGVRPDALIGHSLGEYTAATLAGVMSLEEMLPLIAERIRLIASAGGATVSVALGEADLREFLTEDLSLAAVNGPNACTAAGPAGAVAELERRLAAAQVPHRRLRMPAAAHSRMLDPILPEFAEALRGVTLRPPRIPYVTNVTGSWITDEQAVSPAHWLDHTRHTVRFADGVASLWERGEPLLVEVGPGDGLSKLALSGLVGHTPTAVATMRHAKAERPDGQVLTEALGRLWAHGLPVDLAPLDGARPERRRVQLPGYAFDRRRHWIPAPAAAPLLAAEPDDAAEPTGGGRTPRGLLATAYVAPRTDRERTMAEHWEEALGIDRIGIHDNFFDLGGDSMRAVLLTGRLRSASVLDVPVAALLASPTIAGLLEQDGTQAANAFAPLLALRPDGDQRPLFCVHPGGGMAWRYAGLLPRLGAGQPVYGFQSRGLDGVGQLAADAGEMVEDYLALLRSVQPQGPYRILGWSFGGIVAHAMATALQRQGEQIELLALLDAPLIDPSAEQRVPTQEETERQVAALLLGDAGLTLPDDGEPLDVARALQLLSRAGGAADGPATVTAQEVSAIARVMRNNLRLVPGFPREVFRGDVLFFSATGDPAAAHPAHQADPALAPAKADGWRRYVEGTVEDHAVPCGHYDMTRPEPIARIGSVLATALAAPTR